MKLPKVAVIIPNHNGLELLKKTLNTINKQTYKNIRIIVIDNASVDNSLKYLSTQKYIKTIKLTRNFGFAKAVNLGIKIFKADYFLITNNDVLFENACITNLVDTLIDDPDIGIIGPKIYKTGTKILDMRGFKVNPFLGYKPYDLSNTNTAHETEWITGTAMLVKREVFKKIGLFDEKFFFTFEDLDLCFRTKESGFKIYFQPKAIIWHGTGTGFRSQNQGKLLTEDFYKKRYYFLYKAKFYFLKKHANPFAITSSLIFQFLIFTPINLFKNNANLAEILRAFKEVFLNTK
ncbi:MAG TPA: glycosyltransferase family 2 protein [Patescibacteria group bacterium]